MAQLPSFVLGSVQLAPLALLPLPFLLGLLLRPTVWLTRLALLAALPLLIAAPGTGLVGGVVVIALLLRALASPMQVSGLAGVALLWLPVALLQPPGAIAVWPQLLWTMPMALVSALAVAACLRAEDRWTTALLLVVLPFAPFGATLLQPGSVTAALPLPQVAVRWPFAGAGLLDAAALPSVLAEADRVARCLLFAALLIGWIAVQRGAPRLRLVASVLVGLALAVLMAQTAAAGHLPAHPSGYAQILLPVTTWNLAPIALAFARVLTLLLLLRRDLAPASARLDASVGLAASLTLAWLAATAGAFLGSAWLTDPLALGLLALVATALVRSRQPVGAPARLAGLLQLAAAAALAGGAWAGWAVPSSFYP